jgi:hypothetical protein
MARVDPDDDSIERFAVRRYAYDPSRHERRHQDVAAFDNEAEFMGLITALGEDLKARRAAGESIDPREHVTGVRLEAGYRRRQANAHLLHSVRRHRVLLSDDVLDRLELPSNVGVLRSRRSD